MQEPTEDNQKLFIRMWAKKGDAEFDATLFWLPQDQKYEIVFPQAQQMIQSLSNTLVKERIINRG